MFLHIFIFLFNLNIIIDINVKNYILVLEKCFGKSIALNGKIYALICFILALISILTVIDILLVFKKKSDQNKGINFKTEDGTHGTANWMSEDEMTSVLSLDKPGIILGKYNNKLVRLPFDSYFNKNICVFGSSGSMKTIRILTNEPS